MNGFNDLGSRLNFNVEGYYASHGVFPLPSSINVAICTIEKVTILKTKHGSYVNITGL